MSDHRNHGRNDTHDTGSPGARARDDLRTANKKSKPNESRDEKRDRPDDQKPASNEKDQAE